MSARVRSRLKATKYRWALIIPHIDNLETFAKIRRTSGFETVSYDDYFASGVSDASWFFRTKRARFMITVDNFPLKARLTGTYSRAFQPEYVHCRQ